MMKSIDLLILGKEGLFVLRLHLFHLRLSLFNLSFEAIVSGLVAVVGVYLP